MSYKHHETLHPAIAHLTYDQIEELYLRYWNGEPNHVLVKDFDIKHDSKMLIRIIPDAIHFDLECPYCDIPMVSKRVKKGFQKEGTKIFCNHCDHWVYDDVAIKIYGDSCNCAGCSGKKLQEIREHHSIQEKPLIHFYDISLVDKIFLYAYLKLHTVENISHLNSLRTFRFGNFTPTHLLDKILLERLNQKGILLVNPLSPKDAFETDEKNKDFDSTKVQWILNVTDCGFACCSYIEMVEIFELYFKAPVISSSDITDIEEYAFSICSHEILQYLILKCIKLDLIFTPIKSTIEKLTKILPTFPVSATIYFADLAAKNAHNRVGEHNIAPYRAVNEIPKGIENLWNSSVAKQWDQKKYGRYAQGHASVVTSLFSKVLFGDETALFYNCLNDLLHNLKKTNITKATSKSNTSSGFGCRNCQSPDIVGGYDEDTLFITCRQCGFLDELIANKKIPKNLNFNC